uniref:Uncharacterized protein n=1 Tax=Amphimedon queenslandica TaxID=400682 RepID=A0A1X7U4M4_AMPQE
AKNELIGVVTHFSLTDYHLGVFCSWSVFTPDENVFQGVVLQCNKEWSVGEFQQL